MSNGKRDLTRVGWEKKRLLGWEEDLVRVLALFHVISVRFVTPNGSVPVVWPSFRSSLHWRTRRSLRRERLGKE